MGKGGGFKPILKDSKMLIEMCISTLTKPAFMFTMINTNCTVNRKIIKDITCDTHISLLAFLLSPDIRRVVTEVRLGLRIAGTTDGQ